MQTDVSECIDGVFRPQVSWDNPMCSRQAEYIVI